MLALEKLVKHEGFSPKTAYNVSRIAAKIDQELKLMQEAYVTLLKKYSHLDEKGNLAPIQGEGTFTIKEENVEEWKKAYEEFINIDVTIDRYQLTEDDILTVGLSAYHMMALGPVLNLNTEAPCKVLPLKGE